MSGHVDNEQKRRGELQAIKLAATSLKRVTLRYLIKDPYYDIDIGRQSRDEGINVVGGLLKKVDATLSELERDPNVNLNAPIRRQDTFTSVEDLGKALGQIKEIWTRRDDLVPGNMDEFCEAIDRATQVGLFNPGKIAQLKPRRSGPAG